MLRQLLKARAQGAGVLLTLGCATFEPGTDTLSDPVTVITTSEPGPGRDWSCLSTSVMDPPFVTDPTGAPRLVHSVQVISLAAEVPPPGVLVRACAQRDIECAAPLSDWIPLGADGWVDVPLYEGFDGYMEIQGSTIVPAILFYTDPLEPDQRVNPPVGMVEKSILPTLSRAVGTEQDESLGLLSLRAFDCQGLGAPGVTFSLDRAGVPYYFVGRLPSSTVAETDESGTGGFINVPDGIAVVGAAVPGMSLPIATAQSVLVRAGWVTLLRFVQHPAAE